jgi:CBS domain-containing protein
MAQGPATPAESPTGSTIAFLRRHPPFDEMEAAALDFLTARLKLAYYPKDAVIVAPDQGNARALYIVKRGVVRGTGSESDAVPNRLGPGEFFPVAALLEQRPVKPTYRAAADTFCYELAAADFHELLRLSPRFQAYATRYLLSLLEQSRRLRKAELSVFAGEQQMMNRTLRSLITRPPVTCLRETPTRDALQAMHAGRVGSIVVVDPGGRAAGILTRHDILDRVALARFDLSRPIEAIMTPDPRTLPAEASAFDAIFAMARGGFRHIPVVDDDKVIGLITERDLVALQRASVRQINRGVATAATAEALQQAARDIRRLALSLLEQGVAAEQLTLLISTLNDRLTQRIIELEAPRHELAGIDWCWLAFGSEGRYEQTVSTDQDNGIIFADADGGSTDSMRARLLPFARAVNRTLDACGFPLCTGNIMAGNEQWCLSREEWMRQFSSWISNTDPRALLNAAIFFDFRPMYGRESFAGELREALFAKTTANSRFLHQLAAQALQTEPPLGLLRDFAVDDDGGIDLKKSGARLFVDIARVYSLATGTAHTNTAQRLREAGGRIHLSGDEIDAAVEAFYFVQTLRLKQQLAAATAGATEGHNRVDPRELNEVDRRILKACLRQARKLQHRLALDYQL